MLNYAVIFNVIGFITLAIIVFCSIKCRKRFDENRKRYFEYLESKSKQLKDGTGINASARSGEVKSRMWK
jgi:large-conductance mechanosensitive channel